MESLYTRLSKSGIYVGFVSDGSPITTVEDDKKGELLERRKFLPNVRVCGSKFFGEIRTCFRKGVSQSWGIFTLGTDPSFHSG